MNKHNSMLDEIINIVTGNKNASNEAGLLNHAKKRHRRYIRQRVTTIFAAIMVFVVTYAMILPGLAMTKGDRTLVCTYETHEHTDACYRDVFDENGNVIGKELICGQADWTVHEHTDDCYAEITDADGNAQKILVCDLPEIKEHKHDATCYQDNQVLICGKEESVGHTHTDTCYSIENVLTCLVEEHVHDDYCYQEVVNSQLVLVCGNEDPEHVHDDSCYEEVQTAERVLVCGKEEHQHGGECYEEVRTLICGQEEAEEHHHDASCYETKKELVCGRIELHTHTKDCYEKGHENDPAHLICGKTELKAHTHGAGCLVKGKAADEEIIKTAEEASAERLAKDESLISMTAIESTPVGGVENEQATANAVAEQIAEIEKDAEEESVSQAIEKSEEKENSEIEDSLGQAENLNQDTSVQTFQASTDSVSVTVVAEDGTFPEDTQMIIKDIKDENTLGVISDAVEGKIEKIHAVDITFLYEGKEIEPSKPVKVAMIPLESVEEFSDTETQIVHVDHDGEVQMIDAAGSEVVDEVAEVAEDEMTDTAVVFEAKSFSVYALVYTVDFSYGDFEFSIAGESEVLLSDLFHALAITEDIASVIDVQFSDPELVAVEKADGDWKLLSLHAFTSEGLFSVTELSWKSL